MRIPNHNPRRPGVTIFECVGALALLAVLLGLVAQMTVQVDRQAHARWHSRLASATLSNLMEQAAATPWAELESGPLSQQLAEQASATPLPGAELAVEVTSPDSDLAEKKVTLTLSWRSGASQEGRRLSLTSFVYAEPEEEDSP
ncbi:hypothetical protein KOR34_31810 [Posidoniimonas corsicana]|uniref:Uncharacterized protein n=1 Tax=Posidoniimonas corsicana TaxID=1938618 RepID=A0A5C5VKH3_9BACT|nr:hypothetical protein [Posidoniimonas corsicana]TWT38212.1 hypothetical protein KOR34_31810 [Posidoniimonas corsicana]